MMPDEEEQPKKKKKKKEDSGVTIMDFVAPQKVEAFCRGYSPTMTETFSTEVFNESRLREYFKADVCSVGDPLVVYLQMLDAAGYKMTTSITGEPVILVNEKF